MSTYAYYPGCSLHGTAKEYDRSARLVCQALGLELREVEDWNCCGASSAHMVSRWLALSLPARNLQLVEKMGLETMTVPCAACYARLKDVSYELKDPEVRAKIGRVLGGQVIGRVTVEPLIGTLTTQEILDKAAGMIKKPLTRLKVATYYGCLLTRPPKVAQFDVPENPQSMDRLLRVLGAQVVEWYFKTECCGASLPVARTDIVLDLSRKLLTAAKKAGAEAIVTACPMCHSNLDSRQGEIRGRYGDDFKMPIFFFTELLGLALGYPARELLIANHLTDALSLLQGRGLA